MYNKANQLGQSSATLYIQMTKTKNIIDNLGESHDDPFLNYGNQTALDLWEMDWSQFTQSPFTAYRRTYKPRRMGTDAGTG